MSEIELFELLEGLEKGLTFNEISSITGFSKRKIMEVSFLLREINVLEEKDKHLKYRDSSWRLGRVCKYDGKLKLSPTSTTELNPIIYHENSLLLYKRAEDGTDIVIHKIDEPSPLFATVIKKNMFYYIEVNNKLILVDRILGLFDGDIIEYKMNGNIASLVQILGNKDNLNIEIFKLACKYKISIREARMFLMENDLKKAVHVYNFSVKLAETNGTDKREAEERYKIRKIERLSLFAAAVNRYTKANKLKDYIGEDFDVKILAVTNSELIVALRDGTEGICNYLNTTPIIEEDSEIKMAANNEQSYSIGDTMTARLKLVDPVMGLILFEECQIEKQLGETLCKKG